MDTYDLKWKCFLVTLCLNELELIRLLTSIPIVSKQFIIIIMSCHRHENLWPSLATSPYRSSHLAGLQGYIPYPHIAAACMFELVVLLLLGHMWGSIGVYHIWARPCFTSMFGSSDLDSFRDGWPYSWCLVGCCRLDLFNIDRNILV